MGPFYAIIRAWVWDYILSSTPVYLHYFLLSPATVKPQHSSQARPTGITRIPPELILLILRNLPCKTRPELDLFTSVVSAASYSLDVASVGAPLVCVSWSGPGTQALYECIIIHAENRCRLLHRTLVRNPSLRRLIRELHLPRHRETGIVTPLCIIWLSVSIATMCKSVQELDVIYQARNTCSLNEFKLTCHISGPASLGSVPFSAPAFPSCHCSDHSADYLNSSTVDSISGSEKAYVERVLF
jgi:hypothetical protein